MAVQAESLEVLEKAEASPALARAIVRAIEIEMAARTGTLATQHDILLLGTELRAESGELRTELRADTAELRTELRALGTELRAEMKTLVTELRTEMKTLGTELRAEMKTLATKAELAQAVSAVARQMYLAVLGQTAVMLGFTYFLVTQLR